MKNFINHYQITLIIFVIIFWLITFLFFNQINEVFKEIDNYILFEESNEIVGDKDLRNILNNGLIILSKTLMQILLCNSHTNEINLFLISIFIKDKIHTNNL